MSDDYEWQGESGAEVPLSPQYGWSEPPQPSQPKDTPNLAHTLIFFVLIVPVALIGQLLSLLLAKSLHLFGNASLVALSGRIATDTRLAIAAQTLIYVLILVASVLLFPVIWGKPFLEGIHYRPGVAQRRVLTLLFFGLLLGVGITLAGNYLPMPKNPPIAVDMNSTSSAWMMLVFGVTMAPLLEELAFRGFLLGALVNGCSWIAKRGSLSPVIVNLIGVPMCILLTSLPFALLHAEQVSHAWAPMLLIGVVSVVLCFVRLAFNSVAASTVVHAAYNFTLFAGMLIASDGFRHLEKLKN